MIKSLVIFLSLTIFLTGIGFSVDVEKNTGDDFVIINISKSGFKTIYNAKFNFNPNTDILKLRFVASYGKRKAVVAGARIEVLKSTIPFHNKFWLSDSNGIAQIVFNKDGKITLSVSEIKMNLQALHVMKSKLTELLKKSDNYNQDMIDSFFSRYFDCMLTKEDFQLEIYLKNIRNFLQIVENFKTLRDNYKDLLEEFNMFLKIINDQIRAMNRRRENLASRNVIEKNELWNYLYHRLRYMTNAVMFKKIQMVIAKIPVYHDELTFFGFASNQKFNYFRSWLEELRYDLITNNTTDQDNMLYSSFQTLFENSINLFIIHSFKMFGTDKVLHKNCFEEILQKSTSINSSLVKELSESNIHNKYILNYLKNSRTVSNSGNIKNSIENSAASMEKTIKNLSFSMVEGKISIFSELMEDIFNSFPQKGVVRIKTLEKSFDINESIPNRLLFSNFSIHFNRNLLNLINLLDNDQRFNSIDQIKDFENSFSFISLNSIVLLDIVGVNYWKLSQSQRDIYQRYLGQLDRINRIEMEYMFSLMNGKQDNGLALKLSENYRNLLSLFPIMIDMISDNNYNSESEFYVNISNSSGKQLLELTYLGMHPVNDITISRVYIGKQTVLKKIKKPVLPGQTVSVELNMMRHNTDYYIRISDKDDLPLRIFYIPFPGVLEESFVTKDLEKKFINRFFYLNQSIFLYYSDTGCMLPLMNIEFYLNGEKCDYKVHSKQSKIEIIPPFKILKPEVDFSLRAEYKKGKFVVVSRSIQLTKFQKISEFNYFWTVFAICGLIGVIFFMNSRKKYFDFEKGIKELKNFGRSCYAPIIKYRVNRLYEHFGKRIIACFERKIITDDTFLDCEHWDEVKSLYNIVEQELKKIVELQHEREDMFESKVSLATDKFNSLYLRLEKIELDIETSTEEIDMTAYKLGVISYRFFHDDLKQFSQLENIIKQIDEVRGLSRYEQRNSESKDIRTA